MHSRDCWVTSALLLKKSRSGDLILILKKISFTEQESLNEAFISPTRLLLQALHTSPFFLNSFYIHLTCKLPAWYLIGILLFCCNLMLLRSMIFVLNCATYRRLHKYLESLGRRKKKEKKNPKPPNVFLSEKVLFNIGGRQICLFTQKPTNWLPNGPAVLMSNYRPTHWAEGDLFSYHLLPKDVLIWECFFLFSSLWWTHVISISFPLPSFPW